MPELIEIIKKRRSIRKFQERDVPGTQPESVREFSFPDGHERFAHTAINHDTPFLNRVPNSNPSPECKLA